MRAKLFTFIIASMALPAFAADCPVPAACAKMKRIADHCEMEGPCDSLLPIVKSLEAPTKCQRKQAPDLHAFGLCDKHDQDRAFSILAHVKNKHSQKFFCSTNFKNMLKRRQTLKEKYAYAFVPYDPNSVDDEVARENPEYYATITDCRPLRK